MPEPVASEVLNEISARLERLLERQTGGRRSSGAGLVDVLVRIRAALDGLEAVSEDASQGAPCVLTAVENERLSASILACAPVAIIASDLNGRVTLFSPGAEAMLGYAAAEMLGRDTQVLHDPEEVGERSLELSLELGYAVAPGLDVFVARTKASGHADERECTYVCKDGSRLRVLLSVTTLRNARGKIDGYLGIATDVTERALALAEISRMAHHDPLTRVPNRRLFHDRMQMALSHARRENASLALLLIDLDGFKPVNDRLGHPVGDLLLKSVAKRMAGALRESDTLARIGGDEFAVILPRVDAAENALLVAEKIRKEINAPFELAGGYPISISCSIGVAIYPEHGKEEKLLAKYADEAMYLAKAQGGNCTRLSAPVPLVVDAPSNKPMLPRLVWENEYQCGESRIDGLRHEIFECANGLILSTQSGACDSGQFPAAFDAFVACLARSLAGEESVLAQQHYNGLAAHVLQHQRLVGRAVELCQRVGELAVDEFLSYLAQDVVISHLVDEDRLYFPVFGSAGAQRARL